MPLDEEKIAVGEGVGAESVGMAEELDAGSVSKTCGREDFDDAAIEGCPIKGASAVIQEEGKFRIAAVETFVQQAGANTASVIVDFEGESAGDMNLSIFTRRPADPNRGYGFVEDEVGDAEVAELRGFQTGEEERPNDERIDFGRFRILFKPVQKGEELSLFRPGEEHVGGDCPGSLHIAPFRSKMMRCF